MSPGRAPTVPTARPVRRSGAAAAAPGDGGVGRLAGARAAGGKGGPGGTFLAVLFGENRPHRMPRACSVRPFGRRIFEERRATDGGATAGLADLHGGRARYRDAGLIPRRQEVRGRAGAHPEDGREGRAASAPVSLARVGFLSTAAVADAPSPERPEASDGRRRARRSGRDDVRGVLGRAAEGGNARGTTGGGTGRGGPESRGAGNPRRTQKRGVRKPSAVRTWQTDSLCVRRIAVAGQTGKVISPNLLDPIPVRLSSYRISCLGEFFRHRISSYRSQTL